MTTPIDGLVVVDLSSGIPGGYCTRILADGGADVVKVESSDGDALRRWTSARIDLGDDESGALFGHLAASKRSVVVDVDEESDRDMMRELLDGADVIVWSAGSAVAEDPAHHPRTLADARPNAIVVAITPVGLEGPWSSRAHTEFTLQAAAGPLAGRGRQDRPPVSVGGRTGEWIAGVYAATGALIALTRREEIGSGDLLDVSVFESLVITHNMCAVTADKLMRRKGRVLQFPSIAAARDGMVGVTVGTRDHWLGFARMVGREDWVADPTLVSFATRWPRCAELQPDVDSWMADRTVDEVLALALNARIPVSEVGNGARLPEFEQFVERDVFVRDADTGVVTPRPQYTVTSDAPFEVGERSPAPALGEHTEEVRADPPRSRSQVTSAPGADTSRLPLAGLRVVEFTTTWAGPYLGQQLGMFGADVIRVESVQRPDECRLAGAALAEPNWWESCMYSALNTNKRDVTLNMEDPRGRELALQLCAHADVVIENFNPRVMDKWGLGWDVLSALRPDLIQVRIPGYGLTGPWKDRAAYGMTGEQVAGLAWVTGFPDELPQVPGGMNDPVASGHAMIGLLLALAHRRETGAGALVEAPLVGGAISITAEQVIEYSAYGHLIERQGNRSSAAAPQGLYRCADLLPDGEPDRWIALAVESDEQWGALRRALGDPDWSLVPALATHAGRTEHHDSIDGELAAWCADRPGDEIVELLARAGVPVAKVIMPHELVENPQLAQRGWWSIVPHPVSGDEVHNGHPVKFASLTGSIHHRHAPTLGEHNREVLVGLLGLTDADVDELEQADIVGTVPVAARPPDTRITSCSRPTSGAAPA